MMRLFVAPFLPLKPALNQLKRPDQWIDLVLIWKIV